MTTIHPLHNGELDRAVRAGRRMIGLGMRPRYHLRYENVAQFRDDPFGWFVWVVELPDVWATAPERHRVAEAGRAVIAEVLEVSPGLFDVAVDDQDPR